MSLHFPSCSPCLCSGSSRFAALNFTTAILFIILYTGNTLRLNYFFCGYLFVSGFISLDCGLPKDSSYTETSTKLRYTSDENYIETGLPKSILLQYRRMKQQQVWNLRSFPDGIRNCYRFNLTRNTKYLIRATFMYGNYDEQNNLPEFDVHLGPNLWGTIKIENVSTDYSVEIIHVL